MHFTPRETIQFLSFKYTIMMIHFSFDIVYIVGFGNITWINFYFYIERK